jgi:hypothetical protein
VIKTQRRFVVFSIPGDFRTRQRTAKRARSATLRF